ncbi:putative calcium ion binding protein [Hypomontagnella monticulosa]|nr:putative calcium ion binding protein [Hypomontagnella monticulosa]
MRSTILVAAAAGLVGRVLSHGDHGGSQQPIVDQNANWMTKHMAEEHHVSDFDASSFFALHDYDADGHWESEEILRTYGVMDESNKHVPQSRRDEIQRELLQLLDTDKDGFVTRDEFVGFINSGRTLPDMGTGPGHHGDDEYEYEIHHWEKYHDENTQLEDLTHPEDIEHFKKHEMMEQAEERLEKLDKMSIVEDNIPSKFRRNI